MAEELNRLILGAAEYFHDVPMEPYGNIDHVLVAPTGIYAVETEARRKGRRRPASEITRLCSTEKCFISLAPLIALARSGEAASGCARF